MKNYYSLLFFFIFFINSSFASYYETLPKGVRNFTYHLVKTGEISGSYGSSGNFKGYNVNANINADTIKGINSTVDTYLNGLSASDYQNFSFGTFEGNATSNVFVQAFGGGYGLTDKLTIYGFIPYYDATVDLNLKRTSKGRTNVGTAIQLENLPDVDVQIVQSLFVNYYHYQPLGKWQAKNFGDTEIGFMYQLQKWRNAGALINLGFIAPTGKKDNPDILQDIAFGDGQWDLFYEFGGGYSPNSHLSFDLWNRFTYQFSYKDTIRLPDSAAFPITSRKGSAEIKLGNKWSTNFQTNYSFNDQWGSSLLYSFEKKFKDNYKTDYQTSNSILETDTDKISHLVQITGNYSTVNLFKAHKFLAPITFSLAVQSYFAGVNVPKYERYDFEIKLFF